MNIFQDASQIIATQVQTAGLPTELIPILERLTHQRRGWIVRNVSENGSVETALQHTVKLALAANTINCQPWKTDNLTILRQLLVHELPEILGVDWIPGEISLEEKLRLERQQLHDVLPTDFPRRSEIIQLWEDYEKGGLAYFLDKMDAVITAEYYALANPQFLPIADEFYNHALQRITAPTLQNILTKIHLLVKSPSSPLSTTTIFPTYFDLLKTITDNLF